MISIHKLMGAGQNVRYIQRREESCTSKWR